MELLRHLLTQVNETKNDLSQLPADIMSAIRSKIRKGAEDLEQKWANALELVHKAYQVEGVERPDPTMEAGWSQYEENIAYAVRQLAKNRGMDADWRMSSAMFYEAACPLKTYVVKFNNKTIMVEAKTATEIVKLVESIPIPTSSQLIIEYQDPDTVVITSTVYGVKQKNHAIVIQAT